MSVSPRHDAMCTHTRTRHTHVRTRVATWSRCTHGHAHAIVACACDTQGVYLTLSARAISIHRGKELAAVTMRLSSIFARTYLVTEVLMKLIAFLALNTAHRPPHSDPTAGESSNSSASSDVDVDIGGGGASSIGVDMTALILLATLGLLATTATLAVYDLRGKTDGTTGSAQASSHGSSDEANGHELRGGGRAQPRLLAPIKTAWFFFKQNLKPLLLLLPFNAAFGFAGALVVNIVDGSITKPLLGENLVPVLTALTAGIAATATHPITWAANKFSVRAATCFGVLALSVAPTAVLLDQLLLSPTGEHTLLRWDSLVFLYSCHGLGRSVWESIFKVCTPRCLGIAHPANHPFILNPRSAPTPCALLLLALLTFT